MKMRWPVFTCSDINSYGTELIDPNADMEKPTIRRDCHTA